MTKLLDEKFDPQHTYKPRTRQEEQLIKAFTVIKNEKQSASFMRDLLTPKEIGEFSNRLEIARLLSEGFSYQKIADKAKVSTTTVTRVAEWLFRGCGGYYHVLKKLPKKATPASKD